MLGKRVVVQHIPLGGLLEWNVLSHARDTEVPQDAAEATHAVWTAAGNTQLPSHSSRHTTTGAAARFPTLRAHDIVSTTYGLQSSQPSRGWATPSPQRAVGNILAPGKMPLGPSASTHLLPMSAPGLTQAKTDWNDNITTKAPPNQSNRTDVP